MPQTYPEDFPIDPVTTSGAELAYILNRFADAQDSSNSGAQAPQDPLPGMLWLDTGLSPAVLKMRNDNNTGWITVYDPASLVTPAELAKKVAKAGDTMTGSLTLAPVSGNAILVMNKAASGNTNNLFGQKGALTRWQIRLGNETPETGADSGSNYVINRYNDAGTLLGAAMSIGRSDGGVNIPGTGGLTVSYDIAVGRTLYANGTGTALTVPNGSISCGNSINGGSLYSGTGAITGANGMGMLWDGGNANFLRMGSGTQNWAWQWVRSTGQLNWLNAVGTPLFSVNPDATIYGAGPMVAAGRITSNAVGDVAAIYAAAGGIYSDWANIGAIHAHAGGLAAHWDYGMRTVSAGPDGANWYTRVFTTNPAWGDVVMQGYHQAGVYAGCRLLIGAAPYIKFQNDGAIHCAGFVTESDRRLKSDIAPVPDALGKIAQLQAYTYTLPGAVKDEEFDFTDDIHVGLIAQDVAQVFPDAVNGLQHQDRDAADPVMLGIDYGAIAAINAQAIGELLAKVNALEARIATLEGAQPA